MSSQAKPYDLVVFGATSFVGKLVTKYLFEQYGAKPADFKWAMAARDEKKLDELRKELHLNEVPMLRADVTDESSLEKLCQQTRVIITVVGPYMKFGEPLVKVASRTGVHCLDLTGETPYVKKIIELYHEDAVKSGASIIPSCGFDSLPADIGTLMLYDYMRREHKTTLSEVSYYMGKAKGGVSGGTVASLLEVAAQVWNGGIASFKEMGDPYLLVPADKKPSYQNPGAGGGFGFDSNISGWSAAFVAAFHDTKIVHRSNALLKNRYGAMLYREVIPCEGYIVGFFKAAVITVLTYLIILLVLLPPTRALLNTFVLPKPGTGPAEEDRASGYFNVHLVGKSADRSVTVRGLFASDQGDAGYNETARMLTECALTLVLSEKDVPLKGGILTPAAALGMPLVERLRKAGLTLSVAEDKSSSGKRSTAFAKLD